MGEALTGAFTTAVGTIKTDVTTMISTALPAGLAMVVNAMAAEPQEIKIDLPIEIQSLGIHEEINIDLSSGEWEKLAKTCRYLLSILFILFMIHLSRKMFFNGGDD